MTTWILLQMPTESFVPYSGNQTELTHFQQLLDHKYTDSSIRLNPLKGSGLERAHRLFSLCDEFGYTLYLASVERHVFGPAEEDSYSRYGGNRSGGHHIIEDIIEDTLSLIRVIDTDGKIITIGLTIVEENIVQPEPLDRDPDEEDYEGFTGNADAEATQWYRDSVTAEHNLHPPNINRARRSS